MAKKKQTPPPEETADRAPEPEEFELEEMPGGVTLPRKKSRAGRPIYKWNPQYVDVAKALLRKGATTFELAEAFGISSRTILKWRAMYPEFDAAFDGLGPEFDSRIERTLAERAMGYTYEAVKIFNHKGIPVVVPYVEHVPPDVGAIKHWLAVRQPQKWRVKEEIELTGNEAFAEIFRKMGEKKEG